MKSLWTPCEIPTSPFHYLTNLLNDDQIWYDIWRTVAWTKKEIQRIYDVFKQFSQEPTATISCVSHSNTRKEPHHITITGAQVERCLANFIAIPSSFDDKHLNFLTVSFFNVDTINCIQFLRLCVICSSQQADEEKNPCRWIRLAVIFRRYDSHLKNFLDYTDITRMCRDLNAKRPSSHKPLIAYKVFHLLTVLGEDKVNFKNFLKGVQMELLPDVCVLLQADFFTFNQCYALLSIETSLTNSVNKSTRAPLEPVLPYVFCNIQYIGEPEKTKFIAGKDNQCDTLDKAKATPSISSQANARLSNTVSSKVSLNNQLQPCSTMKMGASRNGNEGSVFIPFKSPSINVYLKQEDTLHTTCSTIIEKEKDTSPVGSFNIKNNRFNDSLLIDIQQAYSKTLCPQNDIVIYCSLKKWNLLCLAWEISQTTRSLNRCDISRTCIAPSVSLTLDQKKIATKLYFLLVQNLQITTYANVPCYTANCLHSTVKTSEKCFPSHLHASMKLSGSCYQSTKYRLILMIQLSSQIFYDTAQWISEHICDYHFTQSFRYTSGTLRCLTCCLFLSLWCTFLIKVTLNLMVPFHCVESSVLEALYDIQRHIVDKKRFSKSSVNSRPFRCVKLLEYLDITPFDLALQLSIAQILT